MLDQDAADNTAVRPFQHLNDRAFAPPLAIQPDYPGQRPVAVQHFCHLLGIEEKIAARIVRHQKAVAIGVSFDPPGDQAGAHHALPG